MAKIPEELVSLTEAFRQSREKDLEQLDILRQRIEELEIRAKHIGFAVDASKAVIIGIIIVLFIAFLTFVLDAWRMHAVTYDEFSATIESLKKDSQQARDKLMEERLQILERKSNKK